MANAPIHKVANNEPLTRLFDYQPPAGADCPLPRTRERVPFCRQRQVWLVVPHDRTRDLPQRLIRRVLEALVATPLLRDVVLWLIRFTSEY